MLSMIDAPPLPNARPCGFSVHFCLRSMPFVVEMSFGAPMFGCEMLMDALKAVGMAYRGVCDVSAWGAQTRRCAYQERLENVAGRKEGVRRAEMSRSDGMRSSSPWCSVIVNA